MELTNSRSQHLFLLVGSNPLPVFVAAWLLSRPGGTIYLIHTKDTFSYAQRLKDVLSAKFTDGARQFLFIELSFPTDQFIIHQDLGKNLSRVTIKAGEAVGFNYTGGMKSMAVHAYEYFKDWCTKDHFRFIFSYLDPLENCLRFANGEHYHPTVQDCELSFTDLLALHGRKITDSETKAVFPEIGKLLADIAAKHGGLENMRKWRNKFLVGIGKEQLVDYLASFYVEDKGFTPSELFPDTASLNTFLWDSFRTTSLVIPSNAHFAPSNPPSPSVPVLGQLALAFVDSDRPNILSWDQRNLAERLVNYLDGKWLENFVLTCLEAISDQVGIHERKLNIHFNKSASPGHPPEFDVAAMQGYRLFAISCTVSDNPNTVKQKLFEAYIRAKQMGGDEAKVALISGYTQTDNLLNGILEEWMEPRNRFKVFGPQHFRTLKTELKDWISG